MVKTCSWLFGFLPGSPRKVLQFQNLARGMRTTLHQLRVLLTFLIKWGRSGRLEWTGYLGLMRYLTITLGGKILMTVLRFVITHQLLFCVNSACSFAFDFLETDILPLLFSWPIFQSCCFPWGRKWWVWICCKYLWMLSPSWVSSLQCSHFVCVRYFVLIKNKILWQSFLLLFFFLAFSCFKEMYYFCSVLLKLYLHGKYHIQRFFNSIPTILRWLWTCPWLHAFYVKQKNLNYVNIR